MKEYIMQCKVCGAKISKTAKACPYCGEVYKKPIYKRIWIVCLLIVIAMFAIRSFNIAKNEAKHEKAGYGVFQFADGTTATAKDINTLYDESAVSAKATYLEQTVIVTMKVTNISDWAIEDATGLIRFSYSDYTLNTADHDILSNLREGDIIRVTGTISTIGGGNWYIQLGRITDIDKIS